MFDEGPSALDDEIEPPPVEPEPSSFDRPSTPGSAPHGDHFEPPSAFDFSALKEPDEPPAFEEPPAARDFGTLRPLSSQPTASPRTLYDTPEPPEPPSYEEPEASDEPASSLKPLSGMASAGFDKVFADEKSSRQAPANRKTDPFAEFEKDADDDDDDDDEDSVSEKASAGSGLVIAVLILVPMLCLGLAGYLLVSSGILSGKTATVASGDATSPEEPPVEPPVEPPARPEAMPETPVQPALPDSPVQPTVQEPVRSQPTTTVASRAKPLTSTESKEIDRLVSDIANGDESTAAIAAARLMDQGDKTVDALAKAIASDPRGQTRFRAARLLQHFGPSSAPAIPALLEGLDTMHLPARNACRDALISIGPESVHGLMETARTSPRPTTRVAAIEALIILSPDTVEMGELYADLALNGDSTSQVLGLHGLREMGSSGAESLGRVVSGGSVAARKEACRLLNDLGPRAAPALPGLIDCLENGPDETKGFAAATLVRVGDAAVEPLVSVMKRSSDKTAEMASKALARLGTPAVEPLAQIVASGTKPSAWYAATALGEMGRTATPAYGRLESAANSSDDTLRYYASEAMRKIGRP
jgi:HEAT repeat protein